jgi:RNA-directed DNA polymerase
MSDRPTETTPVTVPPQAAKQVGAVDARWAWTQPAVWSERMLEALDKGVKGGKWFSLIDKVIASRTLRAAWTKVRANGGAAGVDRQTVAMFERHLEANLDKLARELKENTYQPAPVRRVWIDKPGSTEKRPLGIPTVRDRVVQTALRYALEPIFEREFAAHSYGFRPNRGCKDALRRVDQLLKEGYTWVVDADLRKYFDTIPREGLLEQVRKRMADGRVLGLIEAYLKQQVMDGLAAWTPDGGTPQGAIISPLLANIYLDPLDHAMEAAAVEMVRYADDLVILCRSREQAEAGLGMLRQWTAEAGLTLHPEKTRVVDAAQRGGFDFLGYHFERGFRWPRKKSLDKLKTALREKTPRTSGHSMECIITEVNKTLRGWFEYFKHSHRTTFEPLDKWVRMRLRSILRKRHGGRGCGKGHDHLRWPNAYFAKLGLFSLCTARALAVQSARR